MEWCQSEGRTGALSRVRAVGRSAGGTQQSRAEHLQAEEKVKEKQGCER